MYQHNLYPAEWHSLHRELLEELRPSNDFALFSRSGWIGTQGTAQIAWIGDQETDWSDTDGLPTVVPALLNLGLSGVPFVTHDVGGFSSLPGEPPRSKELFMRWTELGAFTTIMRTHEGLKRADNWKWSSDAATTDHFRRLVRVHQALSPRFHALVAEAASTSMPPLRHLVLVFPDDPEAVTIDDEFLIGNDLLVAPVVVEGAVTRHLYLPAGLWYHAFTGVAYDGVDAPLGMPPAFFRNVDDPTLRNAATAP
jgi:alpha-glucosidase